MPAWSMLGFLSSLPPGQSHSVTVLTGPKEIEIIKGQKKSKFIKAALSHVFEMGDSNMHSSVCVFLFFLIQQKKKKKIHPDS